MHPQAGGGGHGVYGTGLSLIIPAIVAFLSAGLMKDSQLPGEPQPGPLGSSHNTQWVQPCKLQDMPSNIIRFRVSKQ